MRISDIINEERGGNLYHVMKLDKAVAVLSNDSMPALWQHNIPGVGIVSGNSFTRNPAFGSRYTEKSGGMSIVSSFGNYAIRLHVDQAKLANTHRIIPVNGELIYQQTQGNTGTDDRAKSRPQDRMDEEFVVGDIKNLHRYLTAVEVLPLRDYVKGFDKRLARFLTNYSTKFNIPLTMDDDTKDWFRIAMKHAEPEYPKVPHLDKSQSDAEWDEIHKQASATVDKKSK